MSSFDDGLAVLGDEPLSRHTAWRTGGRCDALVWVHRPDELDRVISECREVGWKWTLLGAGTRTVVRDGPFNGVVIRLGTGFSRIEPTEEAAVWNVGAAVPLPALVAAARSRGFSGVEQLAAVPGSVGASLHLDTGWDDVVERVHYLHRGKVRSAPLDEVQGRNRVVTGCRIRLVEDTVERVSTRVVKVLDPAKGTPPSSWYEPPKKGRLRRVLGSVELPRVRLRRVAIPAQAPEVLVNLGEGSAADLHLLHRSAIERVKKVRGLQLESRVRWIGTRVASTHTPAPSGFGAK